MELTHSARVDVPVDRAWAVLGDLDLVAASVPGATLDERDGDTCRGTLSVRFGPLTVHYAGSVTVTERDEGAHRAAMAVEATELDGVGDVQAAIDVVLTPAGDRTRISVTADVTATGRAAQYGQAVLADVGDRLLAGLVTQLHATALADDLARSRAAGRDVVAAWPEPEPERRGRRRRRRRQAADDDSAPTRLPVDAAGDLSFDPPAVEEPDEPAPSWAYTSEGDDAEADAPLHLTWERPADPAATVDERVDGRPDRDRVDAPADAPPGPGGAPHEGEAGPEPVPPPPPPPPPPAGDATDPSPAGGRTPQEPPAAPPVTRESQVTPRAAPSGPPPADERLVWKPEPAAARAPGRPAPPVPPRPRPVIAARVGRATPPPAPERERPAAPASAPGPVAPRDEPAVAPPPPAATGSLAGGPPDDAAPVVPDAAAEEPALAAEEGAPAREEPAPAPEEVVPPAASPSPSEGPPSATPRPAAPPPPPPAPDRAPVAAEPSPPGDEASPEDDDRRSGPVPPIDVVGAPATWSDTGVAQRAVPVALVLALLWVLRRLFGSSGR